MSPLSTFGIPVTLHRLLGSPDNLELRKRKGMVRLTFNDIGLAGHVGDVDAGHARVATRNGAVCVGHLWGSLPRDLRADLCGDPTVLPCHSRALGARREELFLLCLVEFHDK